MTLLFVPSPNWPHSLTPKASALPDAAPKITGGREERPSMGHEETASEGWVADADATATTYP